MDEPEAVELKAPFEITPVNVGVDVVPIACGVLSVMAPVCAPVPPFTKTWLNVPAADVTPPPPPPPQPVQTPETVRLFTDAFLDASRNVTPPILYALPPPPKLICADELIFPLPSTWNVVPEVWNAMAAPAAAELNAPVAAMTDPNVTLLVVPIS